jgi:hypothetical protein
VFRRAGCNRFGEEMHQPEARLGYCGNYEVLRDQFEDSAVTALFRFVAGNYHGSGHASLAFLRALGIGATGLEQEQYHNAFLHPGSCPTQLQNN